MYPQMMNSWRGWGGHVPTANEQFRGWGGHVQYNTAGRRLVGNVAENLLECKQQPFDLLVLSLTIRLCGVKNCCLLNLFLVGKAVFTVHAFPLFAVMFKMNCRLNVWLVAFFQCKEKMRPVKKALKQLDKARDGPDDKSVLSILRQCLLQIGDHITKCLNHMSDPEQIKFWRT